MRSFKSAAFAIVATLLAAPVLAVEVGDLAPDFTLAASDGKTYHLADFKGHQAVVLAWYPKAYTSGCTIECKSLAEHGDMIKRYDVTYFMASVDELDKNVAFAKDEHADFPLLSDADKSVAKAYGVLHMLGFAQRQTFYIGTDGKILAIDRTVKPETAAQDIAAQLATLKIPQRPGVASAQ
jgi:thioredoxin-dependent peroxiredoxin